MKSFYGFFGNLLIISIVLAMVIGVGSAIRTDHKVTHFDDIDKFQYSEYEFDKIFRDYDGYRVLNTESNGIVSEHKYIVYNKGLSVWQETVPKTLKDKFSFPNKIEGFSGTLVKDLNNGKGVVRVLSYKTIRDYTVTYIEVHLLKDDNVNMGIDSSGGKNPEFMNMEEIK